MISNDYEINSHIEDCFSAKLKIFEEIINFQFNEDNFKKFGENKLNGESNINNNNLKDEDYEELLLIDEVSDSLDYKLKPEFIDINNKGNLSMEIMDIRLDYLNELQKKIEWEYLEDNTINAINTFMKTHISQDTYFNINSEISDDYLGLSSLKNYEKGILDSYLLENKSNFMKKLNEFSFNLDLNNLLSISFEKEINDKKENQVNITNKILEIEKGELILVQKIIAELNNLKNDKNIVKIDYLTILVAGIAKVGKSTLINATLKKKVAETGILDITTRIPSKNENEKIKFFKMIDTRGIEMCKEQGMEKIFNDIKSVIDDPNELKKFKIEQDEENIILGIKNERENFNINIDEITYNDYVQCIWYCVKNKKLEKEEITFIKKLTEGQNHLPIIIVYTHSDNIDNINSMKEDVKRNFGNIPFINVLAEDEDERKSFGLEKLINITIDLCRKANKGKIFNLIKEKSKEIIIENFKKKKNETIKLDSNNKMWMYFTNFKKVILDKKELKNYIFNLLSIIIFEYFKLKNSTNDKRNLSEESLKEWDKTNLGECINKYINYYEKNANKYIEKIKKEKAIEFLDQQAKKERN